MPAPASWHTPAKRHDMTSNDNRRAGGQPGHGGGIPSSSSAKVIQFRPTLNRAAPLDALTAQTVIAQHRAGTLPEGVIVALLAGVGLHP